MWGGKQLVSFFGFPHDAAYYLIGLECVFISLYNFSNNKSIRNTIKLYLIVLFIMVMLTNSRVPAFMSIILIVYFYYVISRKKIIFIVSFLYFFIIAILVNILFKFIKISNLPIIDKFIRGYELGDVTSSRDLIWNNIINSFYNGNLKEKVLGNGIGFSFFVNKLNLNLNLWSHNDFFEILLGMGLVGILISIFIYYRLYKATNSLLFTIIYAIVAYWNGSFVYYQTLIFLPAFVIAITSLTIREDDYYKKDCILDTKFINRWSRESS
ncbi:hypothetical protein GNF35_13065 [Clostridium perfringens]|nr:O-antigen ligase family protein [Clostridium perfringens]MDZ5031028.1 hypothetical protein [Clostridium perfringens]